MFGYIDHDRLCSQVAFARDPGRYPMASRIMLAVLNGVVCFFLVTEQQYSRTFGVYIVCSWPTV